jgi:pimeloyl-ACP methyl ester carboxylesterase
VAYFEHGNARIYYEESGRGEPILANHGLAEDAGYWIDTGVAAALAERYRVIAMDMRGHGRTAVAGEPRGFDEKALGADIDALADHLGLARFHLLSHATGGMVAARYGMRRSERLLSLMLTDTGSATQPTMYRRDGSEVSAADRARARQSAGAAPEPPPSYEERRARWRANPDVFTFRMAEHPESDRLYELFHRFSVRRRNPQALAEFRRSFYRDPDPMVDGLRQIACPTLILLGELDWVFLAPSARMAREIPDNRHVILPDLGHMTAIEDPHATARELLGFLDCVARTGRAVETAGRAGAPALTP